MGIPSGNEKLLMRSNHVVLPVSSGKLQRKFPKTGGDKHHCLISLLKYMHHSHTHTHTHTHSFFLCSAWGSERWWCTWRSVALCPVCVAGFWIVPLWPLSTGSSQKVRLWFSAPVITIPTSGWTVSQTPQEYLTVNTTPPWWTCLVRKRSGIISWFHVTAGSLYLSFSPVC